jgi:hypothetical protein
MPISGVSMNRASFCPIAWTSPSPGVSRDSAASASPWRFSPHSPKARQSRANGESVSNASRSLMPLS